MVRMVDDLDGTESEDVETVEFGLDGVAYQIDLTDDNAQRLRDIFAEFVAAARRTGGRIKRGLGVRQPGPAVAASAPARVVAPSLTVPDKRSREELQAIRVWARKHGHTVSERGRIPIAILDEFDRAYRR